MCCVTVSRRSCRNDREAALPTYTATYIRHALPAHYSHGLISPLSPCRFLNMRGWVRCVASGEREPTSKGRWSWRSVPALWMCEATGLCKLTLESSHAAISSTSCRLEGDGPWRNAVFDTDLNGMQERARPLWMQFAQGNVPLHRFLEARQAVQAVFALRRFAGRTFGRPIVTRPM